MGGWLKAFATTETLPEITFGFCPMLTLLLLLLLLAVLRQPQQPGATDGENRGFRFLNYFGWTRPAADAADSATIPVTVGREGKT